MFTSPRECGLCTHHIGSSTDPGLLYLAEWLCPPLPLQTFPSRYAYACTRHAIYLTHPFNGSRSYNFKTTFLYINAI